QRHSMRRWTTGAIALTAVLMMAVVPAGAASAGHRPAGRRDGDRPSAPVLLPLVMAHYSRAGALSVPTAAATAVPSDTPTPEPTATDVPTPTATPEVCGTLAQRVRVAPIDV